MEVEKYCKYCSIKWKKLQRKCIRWSKVNLGILSVNYIFGTVVERFILKNSNKYLKLDICFSFQIRIAECFHVCYNLILKIAKYLSKFHFFSKPYNLSQIILLTALGFKQALSHKPCIEFSLDSLLELSYE